MTHEEGTALSLAHLARWNRRAEEVLNADQKARLDALKDCKLKDVEWYTVGQGHWAANVADLQISVLNFPGWPDEYRWSAGRFEGVADSLEAAKESAEAAILHHIKLDILKCEDEAALRNLRAEMLKEAVGKLKVIDG